VSDIAWYAVCLFSGIALDWAMLERLSTILEVPLQRLPSREYLSTLFPRIVVTLLSLIAVAIRNARLVARMASLSRDRYVSTIAGLWSDPTILQVIIRITVTGLR
jgi:hypothetical protein